MIIKMNLEHAIEALVEVMLPRFSDDKTVLAMSIRIGATEPNNYSNEVTRLVHLLFHRPGNYTKVLWKVANSWDGNYKDFSIWEVKCDHDSEWRTDGLATPMFHIGLQMVRELDSKARPIDCDVVARFDLRGEPKIVTIADYKYNFNHSTFTIKWE